MSEIEREIADQPSCWRAAARLASEGALEELRPGMRVALSGCGTSLYIGQAVAALRERAGEGETDAFPASEFPLDRRYDLVVVVTRSGTTTEVARLLERLSEATRTLAITAVAGSPLAAAAGSSIALDFADERSVVQTRFATTTLALFRAHLGEDLARALADGELATTAPLPIEPREHSHYVFLGRGWTVGLAHEAALKLSEAAQAWTESYPAMEYRHGPISVAGPGSVVWALGEVDRGVLEDAASVGARVVGGEADPMAELVLAQRAAVALAAVRELDPDRPRHLTRSVMLS